MNKIRIRVTEEYGARTHEYRALKTIKKYKSEIENSFVLPGLTNGPY